MKYSNLIEMWNAVKYDGKIGVIDNDEEYSYSDLNKKIASMSTYFLKSLKIKKGDRVGIIIPNTIEFVISYFAILNIGAIVLPINTRLKEKEYKYIIEDARAICLIVHNEQWDNIKNIIHDIKCIKSIIGIGVDNSSLIDFNSIFTNVANDFCGEGIKSKLDDIAVIMYTSGTTGLPKGALMTHENILFNCLSCNHMMGFKEDDMHLIAVPLFHVTGLNSQLIVSIYNRSTVIIFGKFKTEKLFSALVKYPITVFLGVPAMFRLLILKTNVEQLKTNKKIRVFGYAGAPMDKDTILRLIKTFPSIRLYNFYGLTETSSITTVLPAEDAAKHSDSVGIPAPGVEVKVVDNNGEELPIGEIGELWIKGKNIVLGYYNKPEATAKDITNGWLHSGDYATLDEKRRVYLKGRKIELINRGGENIYPIEIENALLSNPKVLEAAVVGVPDRIMGEVAGCFLVLKQGEKCTDMEICDHCSGILADFKVPKYVKFIDALPRNPGGKVVKRNLKEMVEHE